MRSAPDARRPLQKSQNGVDADKTMQSRRGNVICVRLHTRKLTRRPRTVGLPDNDKGASPDLREQIAYM